jgi:hypothetical protein
MVVTGSTLEKLKEEMPFKWRVQSQNEYGATCVAYIDSRLAQDKLDEVVGGENWQTIFKVINDNLFCSVGIRVSHEDGTYEWIWKEDVGTESNVDKEKGNASDSFKRACVHFGVGRFLYNQGIQKLKAKKHTNGKFYPCDDRGNILWDGDELTEYINNKGKSTLPPPPVRPKGEVIVEGETAPRPAKYATPTKEPTYSKIPSNEETMKKVAALDKGGVKGKDCIKKYLPEYNTVKGTSYKLSELTTDDKLIAIVDFINSIPPKV